jgi:YD repeat-containing protein
MKLHSQRIAQALLLLLAATFFSPDLFAQTTCSNGSPPPFAVTSPAAAAGSYCTLAAAEGAMRAVFGYDCLVDNGTEVVNSTVVTHKYACKPKSPFATDTSQFMPTGVAVGCHMGVAPQCTSDGDAANVWVQEAVKPTDPNGHCMLSGITDTGAHEDPFFDTAGYSDPNFPGLLEGDNLSCRNSTPRTYSVLVVNRANGVCGSPVNAFTMTTIISKRQPFQCHGYPGYSPRFSVFKLGAAVNSACSAIPLANYNELCVNPNIGKIDETKSPQHCNADKTGAPCVPATGAKELNESSPLAGVPLSLNYVSYRDFPGKVGLGSNWHHSYSMRIDNAAQAIQSGAQAVIVLDANGYFDTYKLVSTDTFRSTNAVGKILTRTATSFTLMDSPSRILSFDASGKLTAITQRDAPAKSVTLSYDTSGRLTTVTDATNRAITFAYVGTTTDLQSITSPDGQVIGVTLNANKNLSGLQLPGAPATRQFLYENVALPDRVTGIMDEAGLRFSTYTYEASGRVIESKWAGDVNKSTLTYPTTTTATVTSPLLAVTNYTFSNGQYRRTLSATDPAGTRTNTYDATADRVTVSIDKRGVRTEYTYADGIHETSRIEAATGAPQRRISSLWNNTLNRVTESKIERCTAVNASNVCTTFAEEAKSQMTYNTRGQLLTRTQISPINAETRVSAMVYCDAVNTATPDAIGAGENLQKGCPIIGLMRRVDGPRTNANDWMTYEYYLADDAACVSSPTTCAYRKGDVYRVVNALGQVVINNQYDGAGRLLRVTDANGVINEMTYTPRGWLASRKQYPNGNMAAAVTTNFTYTAYGAVSRITQPDGSYLQYSYDQAHRLTGIADNAATLTGNSITYTLDNAGNRTAEVTKDPNANITKSLTRQYDQLSRLFKLLDSQARFSQFTYDANGNQVNAKDPLLTETQSAFDPLNRLTNTIQDYNTTVGNTNINASTAFDYDARDNLVRVTDPNKLVTEYLYDGLNNLDKLTSPDTGITLYGQDAAGNPTSQTDARGVVSNYSFDALNRLTAITYPSDTMKNVTFVYDVLNAGCTAGTALSRLSQITDETGNTKYCYDFRGNITQKTQVTSGQTLTVSYTYDAANRLSSITYPSGAIVL